MAAPPTEREQMILEEDWALTSRMQQLLDAGEYDDLEDILDRKIALERMYQKSRETTWRVWMESTFNLEPDRGDCRTGYWKKKGAQ